MDINEAKDKVKDLVLAKEFTAEGIFHKFVWLFVENAEAIDLIKKYGLPKDMDLKIVMKLAEEISDILFYTLDSYRCLEEQVPAIPSLDNVFIWKFIKNMLREQQYGNKLTTAERTISVETWNRLSSIPEDITNLDDCIDSLIKFYYQHANLSKAQEILSSEEGIQR